MRFVVANTGLCQTGGGSDIQSADDLYDAIRATDNDVNKVARNTGIKPQNIQTVKDHVFYDEHLLDRHVDLDETARQSAFMNASMQCLDEDGQP